MLYKHAKKKMGKKYGKLCTSRHLLCYGGLQIRIVFVSLKAL